MRTNPLVRLLTLAVCCMAFTTSLDAQPRADRITLAAYLDLEDVQDPKLSPDGKQIIYTRRWVDKLNDKWESSLWIVNADGTRNRFLTNGSGAEWSPDGTRIAYLATGQPSGTQVFVRWMDAEGAASQVTRLTETPSDLDWSPDGRSIAYGCKKGICKVSPRSRRITQLVRPGDSYRGGFDWQPLPR